MRGHCFDCDQEVEGRGPWCLLYAPEGKPCGGDLAAEPPHCGSCDERRLSWLVETEHGTRCTTCLDEAAESVQLRHG